MQYESTRGGKERISAAEAIKKGIAANGGLYVPERFDKLTSSEIEAFTTMTYQERAMNILSRFLDDFTRDELRECVYSAYSTEKFTHSDITPLATLNDSLNILELWHGPTCAFKDVALQILPHFMVKSVQKTGENSEIVILVATSGDTGKAALEGFRDVDGTRIIVFYPEDGVSEIQKRQMSTQEGANVEVFGVEGNFDDTQTGVKTIFTDAAMIETMAGKGMKFSSANSINWGRLVPQIVYYFSAYADMVKLDRIQSGDSINFVVPTGNFGNILAGYYAKLMGLPINKLICASNDNNVLTDFIRTGIYDKRRDFIKTISPSMDILISSNLERLLYEMSGKDSEKVSKWMKELSENGCYDVGKKLLDNLHKAFWAGWSSQEETLKTIECVYEEYNYVCDTHTAVAIDVYDKYVITTGDLTPSVIISTASPFKFNSSVAQALFGKKEISGMNEFELLKLLSGRTGWPVPKGLAGIDQREVRHKKVCHRDQMKKAVIDALGLDK